MDREAARCIVAKWWNLAYTLVLEASAERIEGSNPSLAIFFLEGKSGVDWSLLGKQCVAKTMMFDSSALR